MRILYIDIDSQRPDHLGCYGYHRNTSPNIDRVAGMNASPIADHRGASSRAVVRACPRARLLKRGLREDGQARADDDLEARHLAIQPVQPLAPARAAVRR